MDGKKKEMTDRAAGGQPGEAAPLKRGASQEERAALEYEAAGLSEERRVLGVRDADEVGAAVEYDLESEPVEVEARAPAPREEPGVEAGAQGDGIAAGAEAAGEAPALDAPGGAPEPVREGPEPGGQAALDPEVAELLEDLEVYEMEVQAQALEGEIAHLETKTIPAMERQAQALGAMEREVEGLFAKAYKEPELAKALYDQAAIVEGTEAAARRQAQSPSDFGDLRGSVLRPWERRAANEALEALAHRGPQYHEVLKAAERSGLGDADLFAGVEERAPTTGAPGQEGGLQMDAGVVHAGAVHAGAPEETAKSGNERFERLGRTGEEARVEEPLERQGANEAEPHRTGAEVGTGAEMRSSGVREARAPEPSSASGVEGRLTEKERAFAQRMEHLYEHPARARANYERIERRMGAGQAAYGLSKNPEGLGRLRSGVARSTRVRATYARAAALAALERGRARAGAEREGVERTGAGRHAGLEAARDRLERLRSQVHELSQRVQERTATNGRIQGMSLGEQRRSIEGRIGNLSEGQQKLLEAEVKRRSGHVQGKGAVRGGRARTGRPRKGVGRKGVGAKPKKAKGFEKAGKALSKGRVPAGTPSMVVAQLVERATRRVAAELAGREVYER